MVIEMEMYYQIRAYYNAGKSIRWIAKTLGIARQTVHKYCEGETLPNVRKVYNREPSVITEDIKQFVLECLREDEEEGIPKQKHTAKRIHDRLVLEKGYTGAESTTRKLVHELREQYSVPSQADVPLEFDPGDAVQIDWGECTAYLDGIRTKLYIFCGRLCYSCAIFVQAYYSQNMESFLEALQQMFDFFGGVPKRVIFDNAKVAVKDGFGLHARATDGYAAFAAHYAFIPEFCNIASGNEKGLVENLVGYARRNIAVPVPRVKDIDELNCTFMNACIEYRESHKVESRSNPVRIDYLEDLSQLQNIPCYRFDTSRTVVPRVNDYALIRFDRNDYSVPAHLIRKNVTVKGYANKVHIVYNGEQVATHGRIYGSGKTVYQLEHYIDLLEKKPRSVFQAKPVRSTVARELMEWGKSLPGGNKEMVKLLRLCVDYGEEKILSIRHSFPDEIIPTVDMVRSCLHEAPATEAVHISHDIDIQPTDLHLFDEKCGVI